MKLSGAYLEEQLVKKYEILDREGISGSDGYSRPFLMEKGKKLPEGHVWVISRRDQGKGSRAAAAGRDRSLRIIIGWKEPNPAAAFRYAPCLCIGGDFSPIEVLNDLQQIYDRCDLWQNTLGRLLIKQGTVQQALEISAELLGNPLTVMSTDFSLTAEAGTDGLKPNARLFTEGNINLDYMNAFIQDETYQRLLDAPGPVIVPPWLNGSRSMNLNLRTDGRVTHYLVMTEARHPLSEADSCLLKELGTHLEYLLMHAPSVVEKDDLDDVCRTLVMDRTADYMAVSRRLSALGWSERHLYLCLVLQTTYLDQKHMTTTAICKYIKKQFPDSASFQKDEEIVVFLNLTRLQMDEETAEGALTFFIRDSFLKAGYSRCLIGHMNLRRQYLQARTALETGVRWKPYQWIHRFNQIALRYMLEQTTRKLPATMLCHEKLLELKHQDELHQSELLLTLKTYLEQNLNATQTANALFIHRSTLLYRLDKIRDILQSGLEDPDELFYLNLSIRLLEMEGQQNRKNG